MSARVLPKRHSIAENGAAVAATLLWTTFAPRACSRAMPASKPYSEAKSAGSAAATKLLRITPSMCPRYPTPGYGLSG
ncbi:MAG: hypothetical protein BWX64_02881 [Acidobacteria bacterium ADurb.Bin051]|nr:MAG: hypothetical protein BWX64_02881 [Acidobacteria bacterium ADurb.Bin051]